MGRHSGHSRELLTAMGDVTVMYEFLRNVILHIVWELIGDPQELGRIITSQHRSLNDLLNLFRPLIKYRLKNDKELKRDANQLIKDIECVQKRRNDIIHSLWVIGLKDGRLYAVQYPGGKRAGKIATEEVSVSDVDMLAGDIGQVVARASLIHKSIRELSSQEER